jgi:vacuolar protein sorting-associated protein 72
VITNHPARYRDPKTGLPYYNAYAFKEIRKLYSGKYRWSTLVGAWIGSGTSAAIGVPARFMNPDASGPVKELPPSELPTKNDDVTENSKNKDTEPLTAEKQSVVAPVLSIPAPNHIPALATASPPRSDIPATAGGLGVENGEAYKPSVTDESSISTQPYVATTSATFVLHSDCSSPIDTPEASNTVSKTIDSTSTTRPTDIIDIAPGLAGLPTATSGDRLTSPAPITAAE